MKFSRLFSVLSWIVTGLVVAALLGFTFWKTRSPQTAPTQPPAPTAIATEGVSTLPSLAGLQASTMLGITRLVSLTTNDPGQVHYNLEEYTVQRGDSLFGIAKDFNIKPETLYWANADVFAGDPDSLKPDDVLRIPPVDGVYYKWQNGDTMDTVAAHFKLDPEVILNWPGNNLDLTDPQIAVGAYVMIPGAKETDQPLFITTVTRYSGALAQACGGGYIGRGYFNWPAPAHSLSGYDYGEGGTHRGIDISAKEGTPIYAADNGVVTMASFGAWNYGYGNVIQIDHGNGFVTLYAHLSDIYVGQCQSVLAGANIGAAGNTGNSSGAHLHFEIRFNGTAQNPWLYLP
jgi:murein DD-endopeptidase MepM/ murein hydrolase activator NlpD